MHVLLLYPEFPDTFWSFKHALKFIRKQASLPPLGLLTVAVMLPEQWVKRLVDINARKLRERGAVFFVDDNFISNKRTLKEELLPALIRWQKGNPGTPVLRHLQS